MHMLCACIWAPSGEQAAALQGVVDVVREARVMGPLKVSQEFQLQELCSETESYFSNYFSQQM